MRRLARSISGFNEAAAYQPRELPEQGAVTRSFKRFNEAAAYQPRERAWNLSWMLPTAMLQ